ncbi:MAG: hypothetical protein JWR52_1338 [Marmoricola sp.]|nr:hypothetical protein [Marmoricola sp.]
MTSMPTRIDADLFEAAQSAGAVMSRSATQQINYWARIGREFESARGVNQRDIAAVLAGRRRYDGLGALEQAVVRAEWDERITEAREGLNLAAEFEAAGETWVEADAAGRTVTRSSAPKARRKTPKKAVASASTSTR